MESKKTTLRSRLARFVAIGALTGALFGSTLTTPASRQQAARSVVSAQNAPPEVKQFYQSFNRAIGIMQKEGFYIQPNPRQPNEALLYGPESSQTLKIRTRDGTWPKVDIQERHREGAIRKRSTTNSLSTINDREIGIKEPNIVFKGKISMKELRQQPMAYLRTLKNKQDYENEGKTWTHGKYDLVAEPNAKTIAFEQELDKAIRQFERHELVIRKYAKTQYWKTMAKGVSKGAVMGGMIGAVIGGGIGAMIKRRKNSQMIKPKRTFK